MISTQVNFLAERNARSARTYAEKTGDIRVRESEKPRIKLH